MVFKNDDFAKIIVTSDEWIRSKSGIRSRCFAKTKKNEDMAIEAAVSAIENAKIKPEDISVCIAATFTADNSTPALACSIAHGAGLSEEIVAFDLNGACSGFILACSVARGLMMSGQGKYALVVGSEKISPFIDFEDRGSCVLFGDGAGAAVIELCERDFQFYAGCRPNQEILKCDRKSGKISMAGQEVYRFAVSNVPMCIRKVMDNAGCTNDDIDYFVCHQANERIIDNAARRIGSPEKFYKNLYTYGNTSAASVPIALSEMNEKGMFSSQKEIVCTGFGAGLTYAAMKISVDIRK